MNTIISVIMTIFNESLSELQCSINSILKQTYSNIELIIINDNPYSINKKKYLLDISQRDNRIKLIFNKQNIGVISSRNKGLQNVKGDYIAIMDGDDISKNYRLSSQLSFLKENNLDLICSNFSTFNDNEIIQQNCYSNKTQLNQNNIKKALKYFNIAMGPTLFLKQNILRKVKEYRNILVEDYDIVVRALVYGYKVGYQSNSLLYKRNRLNSLSGKNSLKEFVIVSTISKYLKKDNFNDIIPLSLINKSLNKISSHDITCYNKFINNSLELKKKWSLFTFLKMYYAIFTSKLVLERNLWMIFINKRQDKFL